MSHPGPRVGILQDGARRHYEVPVALRRAGVLDRVFTDWYAPPGSVPWRVARAAERAGVTAGRRMRERHAPGLDGVPVHANPVGTLVAHLTKRWAPTEEAYYERAAARLARWLLRGRRLDGLDALFGFARNLHPIAAAGARRRGLRVLLDQIIAPAAVEAELVAREADRWPGWESAGGRHDYPLMDRMERDTWAAADHVTCGSEFVRDGLLRCGVPADRVTVIPYTVVPPSPVPPRPPRDGPVTVGFVGAVGLRKGVPYVFQTAKRFDPAKVRFVMVGRVGLDPAVVERERGAVELVGGVPRSAVKEWLGRFDVFFFPSTCEGSAGAVVEALATGLPVVTTPGSGTSVRDGVEGFVSAPDDVDRHADAIARLAADPDLRARMGEAAARRLEVHGVDRYGGEVAALIRRLIDTPGAP